MTDDTFKNAVKTLIAALVLFVVIAVGGAFWRAQTATTQARRASVQAKAAASQAQATAKALCDRVNVSNAGIQALFSKALAAPPAALPPNPTDAQRKSHEAALAIRADFEANLHRYFDPIKC